MEADRNKSYRYKVYEAKILSACDAECKTKLQGTQSSPLMSLLSTEQVRWEARDASRSVMQAKVPSVPAPIALAGL